MNKVLLISEKTIKKYTLINDNIDGEYLLPAIQMSQDVDLDTTIGTKLNKKIQDLVLTNEINTEANVHYKKTFRGIHYTLFMLVGYGKRTGCSKLQIYQ